MPTDPDDELELESAEPLSDDEMTSEQPAQSGDQDNAGLGDDPEVDEDDDVEEDEDDA